MKIVALLTFRDEERFLPYLLASLSPLVDHVVALDDRSTDNGPDLLHACGATVIRAPTGLTFGGRRQLLLTEGRRAGGTHFVAVDADEAFTAPFSKNGRARVENLRPGEALALPFRTLWKGWGRYRVGREYDMPLACIFRDDGTSTYEDSVIHESRLPGHPAITVRRLPPEEASMVHFQFTAWNRAQIKQAWYRCKEYVGGASALRVNARYVTTLDGPLVRSKSLDPALINHLPETAPLAELPPSWHLDEIRTWFDRYGPAHFESLQIWHVPELLEDFTRSEARPPRSPKISPQMARFASDAYGSARAVIRRLDYRR